MHCGCKKAICQLQGFAPFRAHNSHPVEVCDTASPRQPLLQATSVGMAALLVFATPLLNDPAQALEIVPPASSGLGTTSQPLIGAPANCTGVGCIQYTITLKQIVANRVAKDGFFGGDAEWRLHGKFGPKDIGDINWDLEGNTTRRQVRDLGHKFYVNGAELPLDLVIEVYEDDDLSANDPLPTLKETFEAQIAPDTYTLSALGNSEGQYDIIVEVDRKDFSPGR